MSNNQIKILAPILFVLSSLQVYLALTKFCLQHLCKCEEMSRIAKERHPRRRLLWKQFRDSLSDRIFRRMFRMSKECFEKLTQDIINAVGEEEFKSEEYLNTKLHVERDDVSASNKRKRMFHAHSYTSGGYICGEVKLALTLRLLSGASYLDVAIIYCCGYTYTYEIFHDTLQKWINNDDVIPYAGLKYLDDFVKMKEVAKGFSQTGSHNGIIAGCIGAIDGWLVKIRCPKTSDGFKNITGFYCRKGFYAVNVQAIVNYNKEVLFRSIMCRGSEHDSSAFKRSPMYVRLMEKFEELYNLGYYFVGDSAYALRSFLMVPYDNAAPQSKEDAFNYHHSTCRIWVECAFGEIDMRWGILWRPLQFQFSQNTQVIDACMRLHNFLVRNREMNGNKSTRSEDYCAYEAETLEFIHENPTDIAGGVSNDNIPSNDGSGRLPTVEATSKSAGSNLRDDIRNRLANNGQTRPAVSTGAQWYRDKYNRVRME